VLARVGINGEAISERLYSIVLTMAVMTSALTPFAARGAPVLYARWRGRFPREDMQTFNLPEAGLKNHVIVAGCDRQGHASDGGRSLSSGGDRRRVGVQHLAPCPALGFGHPGLQAHAPQLTLLTAHKVGVLRGSGLYRF
jgi:hypothetical protein